MGAISGGVDGGIGANGLDLFSGAGGAAQQALQGATSSAITQGIGVAVGLQKSFNWSQVAAAGVSAGVGYEVGNWAQGQSFSSNPVANNTISVGLKGMAGLIVGAASRSLIAGTDFGDNIMKGLPDVIGQTVEGAMEAEVNQEQETAADQQQQQTIENNQKLLVANGMPSDVAQSYAQAAATGDQSFFIKVLTDAGQSPDGQWDLNKLNQAIGQFNSLLSGLPANVASQLSWTFDLARVAISTYSGMQSIAPADFSPVSSVKGFDSSELTTKNGYYGALYYYNNSSDPSDIHNGTYVLADRGTRGFWQNTPESQLDSAADVENNYGEPAPLYDDAVKAAVHS